MEKLRLRLAAEEAWKGHAEKEDRSAGQGEQADKRNTQGTRDTHRKSNLTRVAENYLGKVEGS